MQNAIFCKYICAHGNWSTRYIVSIIIQSNCQDCDEQLFQTLPCVHWTIFSVAKLDLFIQALLLDRILALEEDYAYAPRTCCYYILNKNSMGHLLRTSLDYFRPPPPPQSSSKEMDNIFILFLCTFSKSICWVCCTFN